MGTYEVRANRLVRAAPPIAVAPLEALLAPAATLGTMAVSVHSDTAFFQDGETLIRTCGMGL
jgi:hypothetical protein